MKCVCSKCGYQLESVILDKDVALQEIGNKLNRHLAKDHKDLVEPMQEAMKLGLAALMMVGPYTEFVFVPEDEDYIQEKMDKGKEIVMALLGYDLTEDEDEDEEEETEDGEEEVIETAPDVVT